MLGNLGPICLALNDEGVPKSPTLHYAERTRICINCVIQPCCYLCKSHASSCPYSHRTFERTQGQCSRRRHVPCQPPAQTSALTGRLACRWKRAQVLPRTVLRRAIREVSCRQSGAGCPQNYKQEGVSHQAGKVLRVVIAVLSSPFAFGRDTLDLLLSKHFSAVTANHFRRGVANSACSRGRFISSL